MPTRSRTIPADRADSPRSRRTKGAHWTRDEQIENAKADGTVEEMSPPITDEERVAHGIVRL